VASVYLWRATGYITIRLENWPETSRYPPRAAYYIPYKGESRGVTAIITAAELMGFSSDLDLQETVDRKQHKYTSATHGTLNNSTPTG
jgi:hypothetical protein